MLTRIYRLLVIEDRSEDLINKYKQLLDRLSSLRGKVIITGILPKARASNYWISRALGCNTRVQNMCLERGFVFADYWDKFHGRTDLFMKDDP